MIRVGIVGYGNLGRGVEQALTQHPDMELVAIFSRRAGGGTVGTAPIVHIDEILQYRQAIDVMLLCGGSATDLPVQGPSAAEFFNTVDSFDTHAKIPDYFAKVDAAARAGGRLSLISTGWDPGLFSLMRLLGQCILPKGSGHTFWGKGVSQGHSDAIRRIAGVRDAKQYTVPIASALEQARLGKSANLTAAQKHERICYVVAEQGADVKRIEAEIKSMPNYFAGYSTTVYFVSEEELRRDHSAMPHGGVVLHTGSTGNGNKQCVEFGLQLDSNPEFTSSVLVAFARAVARLAREGQTGARTVFDIPLAYLSPKSGSDLRAELL